MNSAPTGRIASIKYYDRTYLPKLILRLCTIIVCLVGIALAGAAFAKGQRANRLSASSVYYDDYFEGQEFSIFLTIPLGLTLIWGVIAVSVMFARKKPVHPGMAVAFDLILWLALAVLGSIAVVASSFSSLDDDYRGYSSCNSYDEDGYCISYSDNFDDAQDANDLAHTAAIIAIVAAAFTLLATILEFVLFVWACVDTHSYNSRLVDQRATVIAEGVIRDMREKGLIVPGASGSTPANPHQGYYAPSQPSAGQYNAPVSATSYQPPVSPVQQPQQYHPPMQNNYSYPPQGHMEQPAPSMVHGQPPQLPPVATSPPPAGPMSHPPAGHVGQGV